MRYGRNRWGWTKEMGKEAHAIRNIYMHTDAIKSNQIASVKSLPPRPFPTCEPKTLRGWVPRWPAGEEDLWQQS